MAIFAEIINCILILRGVFELKRYFLICLVLAVLLTVSIPALASEDETTIEVVLDRIQDVSPRGESVAYMSTDIEPLDQYIEQALDEMKTTINISAYDIYTDTVEAELLQELYAQVCYSRPDFFFVDPSMYSMTVTGTTKKKIRAIKPFYTYSQEDREKYQTLIDEEVEHMTMHIDDHMTPFQKIMQIHDNMVFDFSYDYDFSDDSATLLSILSGKATCMGYTYVFNYIMDYLGIETRFLPSYPMEHAWSLVKIGSKWYHMDVTWDDQDIPYLVYHTYALSSDDMFLNYHDTTYDNHYGYDLGDYEAVSTIYDSADWRTSTACVVTIDGITYWTDEDEIERGDGAEIISNMSGVDGKWNITDRYIWNSGYYWPGLVAFDDKLYFSTDSEICCYNPHTEEISTILEVTGVHGLWADHNVLNYSMYDPVKREFYHAGSIRLGSTCAGGIIHEGNKVVVRLYKDTTDPVNVICKGANGCKVYTVDDEGIVKVYIDAKENDEIFIWDNNLRPIVGVETVVK